MKKLITFFIAFFVTVMAWADDSGSCGGWTVTYTYVESTGTLTISGVVSVKEYMANYESSSDRPWNAYCSSIKNVVINNGVTSIGKNAFYGCTGLTSVTIGNDVTSIGNQAFKGCTGLTSVTIPNSVTEIGSDAFNGCTGLTSVTIPNSVTSIGNQAFYGCTGLTSVTIPNGVTIIGNRTFYGCEGLTSVTIPNSVTSIGWRAFSGCTGLTNITIPNSVTSIGEEAFNGCTGLTSVTIPNSVTTIESAAFSGCTGLTSINVAEDNLNYASIDGVLYSKDKKTLIKCPQGKTGSVTIPNSVTSIESGAFSSCGLTSINVAEDNLNYASIDGVLYSKDKKTLIRVPITKTSFTIPNSVTSIGGSAFNYCTGLTSVTIPNSVTSIGGSAFYGCTGLTSVTIPNSVTSIGGFAFYGCTGLTSMTVEATTPPSCSSNIVSNYNIPLYVPAGRVSVYRSKNEWQKFYYYIQAIPATGVNESAAEKSEVKKIIDRNGIIYIEKDGTRYFLNGGKAE